MERIELKLPGEKDYFVQEALKVLRTNLRFCGQDIKVIAITSSNENEGKTTVTLSIAKSFAELGAKVLVIDADMRKSVMAGRNANAVGAAGLSEVLTGLSTLAECMYPTQQENLFVLFAGQYPPNPVELLSGKYFAALIKEARKHFDYIFVDTPPMLPVIDAAVVAPLCDGVAIVVNNNYATFGHVRDMVEQLNKTGSKILGVVVNNVKNKQTAYYRKEANEY